MTTHPVLVIMGVSGSGKSTVAGILAGALKWDLQEGDDLHPDANVAKMASGHPLTDEDRWPWLETIADWIRAHTEAGEPGIVTCSALKRSYRDVLRKGSEGNVVFVHLAGSRERISGRLNARMNHFMPSGLLDTQMSTLEPIDPDEPAIVIDVGPPPADIAASIIAELETYLRTE
ncbi:carbohydrate kinase [Rhodococcus sp. 15-649-1-2]|uniref:gluconokinase n=1 Tax=Nocardiaceae TaxID=85025 RepID=UPI00035D3E28|nr:MULTISPECIES: gluconokinase [Rhodococcus]OZC79247.1 carbohydrate kinase [Rhodococcus sp. 06-418-1B]OZD15044.1 carbohydrate kinase [Rhodococcus sp. 06-156-4C]OZD19871.1 carbohydrate kinase [Rhodococcus sp. 06-156-4a]OZD22821.1 carbohydrate kinase [Rhodococcus sp. 06-156-3C]OZD25888.1 carbohydrate kinase [Rhodococcus sp. 06-156-3b]